MKKAAIFDVDGTLANGFYIQRFYEYLHKHNSFSTEELENIRKLFSDYRAGGGKNYKQFAIDLVDTFGKGIEGVKKKRVEELGQQYIEEHPQEIFAFTKPLLRIMKQKRFRTLAISGSPEEIIAPFCQKFGIRHFAATSFKTKNGVYTGEVEKNGALGDTKTRIIAQFVKFHNVDLKRSTGFGDTHHDAHLYEVGKPFAVNPNSELARIAEEKHWPVIRDDANALKTVREHLSKRKRK